MPKLSYEYPHPPIELIKTQLKCEGIRPSHSKVPNNRENKRDVYAKARNFLMSHGLSDAVCITLPSLYPDDIAISLYPVIKKLIGYENNDEIYPVLFEFIQALNNSGEFEFVLEDKGSILNIRDILHRKLLIDLDFNGNISHEKVDEIIELLEKVRTTRKFGLIVWCSYGRSIDMDEQLEILDHMEEIMEERFHISCGPDGDYLGEKAHVPMIYRTYILQKRKGV